MNQKVTPPKMSRRNFLKLAAAGSVGVVGLALLDTYRPWINYDQQTHSFTKSLDMNSSSSVPMRELIQYAILAANGHNTQPWKFSVQENSIQIHPDYTRHLAAVDPNDREMWISLGCALENLLIAAKAAGYAAEVTYPVSSELIDVRFTSDTPQKDSLLDAIPLRQNTRSEFDGQPIKKADLDKIQKLALEPGINLHYFVEPAGMETVLEYVNQGNLKQYADKAFIDELIHWLRFNKKEALTSKDGLFSICSGNPDVPRFVGQLFVSSTKPQQQADIDAKKLRSSSGSVVISSDSDDRTAWVRTGQMYERMALTMTSLNIKTAMLNQPIEVAEIRSKFQSAAGLGASLPQLLVRFGYAEALPRSLRRPVEQVLTD